MRRFYETDEEQEANKQGHTDEQRHHRDYDHDKYSDEPSDVAYWQGRHDEERKQRIEEEERQMEEDRQQREFERQMHEEEIRQREQQAEELQGMEVDLDQETVRYYDIISGDMESQDDERPYTEEELFNDILNDERNENELE